MHVLCTLIDYYEIYQLKVLAIIINEMPRLVCCLDFDFVSPDPMIWVLALVLDYGGIIYLFI